MTWKMFPWQRKDYNRKDYNSQHVLIRLIEEWREYLDKDFVIGAVLAD